MKNTRRWLALLLAALMVLALAACGKQDQPGSDGQDVPGQEETENNNNEENTTPDTPDVPETRTVTDQAGAEVTVPGQIDRVAIISTVPLASVYSMMTGEADTIVGLTPASKNAAVHSFLSKLRDFSDVETSFAQGETVNVEAVAALEPDVVFYNTVNAADAEAAAQLTQQGIPCVGFSTGVSKTGDTIATFTSWATLMGQVLGQETRAQALADYGAAAVQMVQERVSAAESPAKKALILNNYTNTTILAAGNTFGTYWLTTCGAENVASGIEKPAAPVDLEQIYAWNPEIILLNSFSAYTPEDILNSTAGEGQDWSGIQAVQDGQVFKFPLGIYYWFAPCSDSPLALQWVAKTLYPELFEDVDLDQVICDYYSEYYGIELTQDDLATLYAPPAESAMGK